MDKYCKYDSFYFVKVLMLVYVIIIGLLLLSENSKEKEFLTGKVMKTESGCAFYIGDSFNISSVSPKFIHESSLETCELK